MSDGGGRWPRIDVRYEFEVPLPADAVWEVVADTQHLNQLLFGTKPAELVETNAFRARIRGLYGFVGPEFEELPWEFEVPHRFRLERIFTRGTMKRTEFGATLTPTATGTKVVYTTMVETSRSPLGFITRYGFRARNTGAFKKVEELLRATRPDDGVQWPPANPYASLVFERAEPFAGELRRLAPESEPTIAELVRYLANAPDYDIARMRPYELADKWKQPRAEVLSVFLQATRSGLLQLGWDILCPSCENPPTAVDRLADLPSGGTHCPACDITFDAKFEESVEATFKPTEAVRESSDTLFCYGSPRRTPNWLAQFVVEPGETRALEVHLGAGRYRLQASGTDGNALFQAGEGGGDVAHALIETADARATLSCGLDDVKAGAVSLAVENRDDKPRRLQLVHRKLASSAVLAPDITALEVFRDLFTDDVLAPGQSLQVGRTVILFTDLVGSTAMYERIGDGAAYSLVRRHFDVMQKVIDEHGGRIVKTIGDAVMASFPRATDGARAAWQGIREVHDMVDGDGKPAELALKVGLHVGPCLAIEANQTSDYFGRTVNVAARVQGLAGGDELVLSDDVLGAPEMGAFVEERAAEDATVSTDSQPIKGVEGELAITRLVLR